jgi:hypothetical protein
VACLTDDHPAAEDTDAEEKVLRLPLRILPPSLKL